MSDTEPAILEPETETRDCAECGTPFELDTRGFGARRTKCRTCSPPKGGGDSAPGRGRRARRRPVAASLGAPKATTPKHPGGITPAALRKAIADTIKSLSGAMSIGGIVANPRLLYDAEILAKNADDLAAELVAVAEKSPPMYAALVSLVKGSQWAKLGGLVVSIAIPIAANHGLLPPVTATLVGAPEPAPRITVTPEPDAAG